MISRGVCLERITLIMARRHPAVFCQKCLSSHSIERPSSGIAKLASERLGDALMTGSSLSVARRELQLADEGRRRPAPRTNPSSGLRLWRRNGIWDRNIACACKRMGDAPTIKESWLKTGCAENPRDDFDDKMQSDRRRPGRISKMHEGRRT
jgi:hypothetical protein